MSGRGYGLKISISAEDVAGVSGGARPTMLCHPAGVLLTFLINLF